MLPFLWITYLGIRYGIKPKATELRPETLYVEETAEAEEDRTGVAVAAGSSGETPHSRSPYASDRRDDVDEP